MYILYGASSLVEAQNSIRTLSETLEEGKLSLHKWALKEKKTLINVDQSQRIDSLIEVQKAETDIKNSGIHYNSQEDCFLYQIKSESGYRIRIIPARDRVARLKTRINQMPEAGTTPKPEL